MDIDSLGMAYNAVISSDINAVNSIINRDTRLNGPNFEDLLKKAASKTETAPAEIVHTETVNDPAAMQAANTPKTATIDKTSKLYEQCLELEIFMVKTLVSSMRNTVQKSGLIEEGFAGKMYEDMLYDEYAREFAKNANFGMAELAYLDLTGQRGMKVSNK